MNKRQDVAQTAQGVQNNVWEKIIADQNSHGFINTTKPGLMSGNIIYLELMKD